MVYVLGTDLQHRLGMCRQYTTLQFDQGIAYTRLLATVSETLAQSPGCRKGGSWVGWSWLHYRSPQQP